jgi:AraC-like DNA-binding protein
MIVPGRLNTYIVIIIYGSLILLAFLSIFNPLRVNRKANFWFGGFLFLWSSFWLEEIAHYTDTSGLILSISVLIRFLQFFTPIVFYISIVYYTNPNFKFRMNDIRFLLLPAVYLVILMTYPGGEVESPKIYQFASIFLILGQVIIYTVLSYLRIRKHQKKILSFASNTIEIDLTWLEYIISSILLLNVVIIFYNIFLNSLPLNVFINSFLLVIIFIIAYNALKQKEIFPLDENQRNEIILINESEQSGELKRKIVSDSDLIRQTSKLSDLMDVRKPYLDSELNLIRLAELAEMTPHQLSYIINAGFNENFFQFINKYRVEKAKELLVQDEMNKLSILGIAFEAGFNSKTSFNTTFKKFTAQTPSEFKARSSGL